MPICECCDEYFYSKNDKTLHHAAAKGYLDVVKFLVLEDEWNPDKYICHEDDDKRTPLNVACKNGHLNVVMFFVEHGAEMNYNRYYDDFYKYCQDPIVDAAENNHLDVVQYLIEKGADMDYSCGHEGESIYRKTPLIGAAIGGHLQVVRFLLEQGVDEDNGDSEGRTALHYAAEKGHLDIMRYLLEQGADKEKTDHAGYTPLHCAADRGRFDAVQCLLEQGAEKDKAGKWDTYTPLSLAAKNGHLDVVRLLVEKGADTEKVSLLDIAKHGHWEVVLYLLPVQKAVCIYEVDYNGSAILHYAADKGPLEVVRLLVEQGADKDKANNDGYTPLHRAVNKNYHDDGSSNRKLGVARYLLEQGRRRQG